MSISALLYVFLSPTPAPIHFIWYCPGIAGIGTVAGIGTTTSIGPRKIAKFWQFGITFQLKTKLLLFSGRSSTKNAIFCSH